jgi:hypothetical protein
MTTLFNSLSEISTGYSVFERDQVLTEAQLNSVSEYLDDQDRLSRVNLTGVGIVCGLRVRLSNSGTVRLGKGLGITTDGDLLRIAADTSYTGFRPYDTSFPKYPPLYADAETMLPAWELLQDATADPLARPLGQFPGTTGSPLGEMAALLLVESYIRDHDLCTGADCDNHSKDYISAVRLVLVDKSSVSALMPTIRTADDAARALDHLVADHVTVSKQITTPAELAARFRGACSSMHGRLAAALPKLWPAAGFLLGDSFSGDPGPGWQSKLASIDSSFAASDTRIQYYFDFLKDLIDTWNEMRDRLFGENAWCCPDISGFPKHLMLGNPVEGGDADENRLGYYPAMAVNRDGRVAEARFLAEKIDKMIGNFSLPAIQNSASVIRVTPSCSARHSLQQRAIPYYYPHVASNAMVDNWSYRLARRDMNRCNYSYHGDSYAAQGGASEPLASAIDGSDFFRIEGHQGQQATTVLSRLEQLIAENNLPFSVCGLLLGEQLTDIVDRKGAGYNDLKRLHYLLRQDVVRKLDEVKTFSGSYTAKVHQAVADKKFSNNQESSSAGLTDLADQHNTVIADNSGSAMQWLNQDYSQYLGKTDWLNNIGHAMAEAGRYKLDLDQVSNTSYNSSFDSWIDYSVVNWLPWLDQIIGDKDEHADRKKLFGEFVGEHPGLEHTGGVNRGGTFVVVYDESGSVVADFMLSHYYREDVESPATEPPLDKPQIPKGNLLDDSIWLRPTLDRLLELKLVDFKVDIDKEWQPKLDLQLSYQDLFQDFVNIYAGGVVATPGAIDAGFGNAGGEKLPGGGFTDPMLGLATDRIIQETQQIEKIYEKLGETTLPADQRTLFESQVARAEENLAKDMEAVARQMDMAGTDVSVGTEGHTTMRAMSKGLQVLDKNTTALNESRTALEGVRSGTGNTGLATNLEKMLGGNFGP